MDRVAFLQFFLLLSAVPAQYYIVKYWSNDSTQQTIAFRNVINQLYNFKNDYLDLEAWKKWYTHLVIDVPKTLHKNLKRKEQIKNLEKGESLALEVFKYRKNLEYFAESTQIRVLHHINVKYKIGQVVKHKKYGFQGVIIGWDARASASPQWIESNYKEDEREKILEQPHYLVLVDAKHQKLFSHKAYVAQEHIEISKNSKVDNKLINAYFNMFDGEQYVPKEFLRVAYPND